MKIKINDKVDVIDGSWCFGICSGQFKSSVSRTHRKNLLVVQTGLSVMRDSKMDDHGGKFDASCDLLLTDGEGNFWFAPTDGCEKFDKKIEVRYFCDSKDVTDEISDETKKNLSK